jgi:hypothetical protein
MHGETAAVATYARRAVKDKDAGKPLGPIAATMNEMAKKYHDTSRPDYCARVGFVDEIVDLKTLRGYLKAFAGAAYRNPQSICLRHQMLLPRVIKGWLGARPGSARLPSCAGRRCQVQRDRVAAHERAGRSANWRAAGP